MSNPTVSWDETSPAGSQAASLGDNRIREMKAQIREIIEVDHEMSSSGQGADWGKHAQISLIEQADLGTGATGYAFLGGQTVSGKPELVYTDEDDNDIQITSGGSLRSGLLDIASIAAGDLFYYNGTGMARIGIGTAGQVLATNSGATAPEWIGNTAGAPAGASKGLVISRPTVATVDIDADFLVLEDTSNATVAISSVDLTVNVTGSGELGLDTGGEASDTWYYLWVIRKSSDGTVSGIMSTASVIGSITFPSGYDQAALVGAVFNDSSSNLVDFLQTGKVVTYVSGRVVMASGTQAFATPIDMSDFVPNALSSFCWGSSNANGQATGVTSNNSDTESWACETGYGDMTGVNTSDNGRISWQLQMTTANTLYAVGAQHSLYCYGYIINKV